MKSLKDIRKGCFTCFYRDRDKEHYPCKFCQPTAEGKFTHWTVRVEDKMCFDCKHAEEDAVECTGCKSHLLWRKSDGFMKTEHCS